MNCLLKKTLTHGRNFDSGLSKKFLMRDRKELNLRNLIIIKETDRYAHLNCGTIFKNCKVVKKKKKRYAHEEFIKPT